MADPASASTKSSANQQQQTAEATAAVLEQALTPEALARLRRIELVKPEKCLSVQKAIVSLAKSGRLTDRITEGKLVEMLERGNRTSVTNSSISIQRKKYALDSDDEDDNDDDLL